MSNKKASLLLATCALLCLSQSGLEAADLETAKTIFVHPMPEQLHVFISGRLAEKGPYRVVLDREMADLWMMGTATGPVEEEPKEPWQETLIEVALILAEEPRSTGVSMTASVYVVARGGEEILWATETTDRSGWVSSNQGPRAHMAKEIVKKLKKTLKKASKKK